MERRLKRLPGEFYFFGILPFLSRLPVRLGYRLAARIGQRLSRVESEAHLLVCRNVTRLESGQDWPPAKPIARSVFENLIYEDLDTFFYRRWHPGNLDQFFQFEGLEHLKPQMEKGEGAILMTAHLGALCAAMVALGIKGFPLTHISREYREDPRIPRAFRRFAIWKIGLMEEKMGLPLVNAYGRRPLHAHRSVLEILQHLRQGHLVSVALDVNPDWFPETLTAPFFGRSGRFSPNPVKLAAAAGRPLIPYFTFRDPALPHRHRILIRPPLELSGDPEKDLRLAVVEFEKVLSRRPDQWLGWDSLTHFIGSVD